MKCLAPPLVVAMLLAVGAACATTPPPQGEPVAQTQMLKAISPPDRLEPPAYLPESARALLRTRMASHAQDMAQLTSAIMALRYADIETHASSIANEPRFAQPLTADATELNAALPKELFAHDRELRLFAAAIASGAKEKNPFVVADAYGKLSEVCVKCHATYRAGH